MEERARENQPRRRKRRRIRKRQRQQFMLLAGVLALAIGIVWLAIFAVSNLLPDRPEVTLPRETEYPNPDPNPYTEADFYRDGEFILCSAADALVGIDVSSHQKDIDWPAVAEAGVDYAMIRLGYRGYDQGGVYVDSNWEKNVSGALEAGLQVGVYFYSQAITVEEAIEEAQLVLKNIRYYDITFPVVFDWECIGPDARTYGLSSRMVTDCTAAFCQTIAAAGYTPMFYFNQSMARDTFRLPELQEYDFWLAQYADAMTFAYDVQMWQYTNSGQVPGIPTEVDLNLSFVDYGRAQTD